MLILAISFLAQEIFCTNSCTRKLMGRKLWLGSYGFRE
jgi:hypothetical protein